MPSMVRIHHLPPPLSLQAKSVFRPTKSTVMPLCMVWANALCCAFRLLLAFPGRSSKSNQKATNLVWVAGRDLRHGKYRTRASCKRSHPSPIIWYFVGHLVGLTSIPIPDVAVVEPNRVIVDSCIGPNARLFYQIYPALGSSSRARARGEPGGWFFGVILALPSNGITL
jgi:hypothetical protein